ncbi:MAG: hypothetical protein P1U70_26220, partial [Saprospiraceae bacterium]|nr:hypothetical protein [Saprospiraceae bacterium]
SYTKFMLNGFSCGNLRQQSCRKNFMEGGLFNILRSKILKRPPSGRIFHCPRQRNISNEKPLVYAFGDHIYLITS